MTRLHDEGASFSVTAADLAIWVDRATAALRLAWRGQPLPVCDCSPRFTLQGKPATPLEVTREDGGVAVPLRGDGVSGVWRLRPAGQAIASTVEVDGAGTGVAVGLEWPVPIEGTVEVPAGQNWGARVGASCPLGRGNGVPVSSAKNQLAVATLGNATLAFTGRSTHTRYLPGSYATVWRQGTYRDEECLRLALEFVGGVPFEITAHAGLDAAIDRYCQVMREQFGLLERKDDPTVPGWLDDLKVMVTFDMWRSDGTIVNDFGSVVAFCRDLEQLGVKGPSVIVRVQGFQGQFDSQYPYFDPAPRLGGVAGFRALTEAVHARGHKLMAHFNLWGMDPFDSRFAAIEHLAMPYDRAYERIPTGQVGPYDGWPGPYPAVPTGYDSGFGESEPVETGPDYLVFETADVPEPCEAYLTLASLPPLGAGRLRATTGSRQLTTAPGALARGGRTRFPYRFRLDAGRNRVRLDLVDGPASLGEATYRIDHAVRPGEVWSYPIVRADIHQPEWIEITRQNLGRVAREYQVDIPYIDAVQVWRPEDAPIFEALKQDLPGTAFACEYPAELGYNLFRLTGTTLTGVPPEGTTYQITDFGKRLHERYTRLMYPGFCFVPFGSPGEQGGRLDASAGERREVAERAISDGRRWGVFPAVLLNYPKYGLDQRAREVILEAVTG
jgi:hypothetical protein